MHPDPFGCTFGPTDGLDPNEIVDERETDHALAIWARRDRERAEARFDAGDFEAEVVAELERTHNIHLARTPSPWPEFWRRLVAFGPGITANVRRAVVNRVLDRERVS